MQPYRDALDATKGLQQSFAADAGRAAAALRAGDDATYADAARAAQLAASEEVRVLADGLKQKLALYTQEARFYEITQQEKLELSQQAISQEYAAELGALQRQDALGEQSLASKQRVDDMLIEATRRRDDQMASLTRSALQEQERDYQAFGSSIAQAFNSQLRGLLTGTTTWHTAFKNALEDLLIKFIEWCETSVAHYALAEAMKTAATTAGVAARTGAEQGGAAASLGAQGATVIRSILSSAAETFAGVFGFLAPLMGPFAVGPATAAQATVAGMAGAVASADIGMWQVPRDQLALIHQNELIMPAGPAGALRDMLTNTSNGRWRGRRQSSPSTRRPISMSTQWTARQWGHGCALTVPVWRRRSIRRCDTARRSGLNGLTVADDFPDRHRSPPAAVDGRVRLRHDVRSRISARVERTQQRDDPEFLQQFSRRADGLYERDHSIPG